MQGHINKGVIEIIFIVQTWRFVNATEMIRNGTCTLCIYPAVRSSVYIHLVWGYCFIMLHGYRQDLNYMMKQIHPPHLFIYFNQDYFNCFAGG
ncbi:MAG: hypothetical protein DBY35_04180 [Bacteroidales bacterium]|nr:MAG: hypothetical protein DBY35_04180 [Bacteroidales bacterium]